MRRRADLRQIEVFKAVIEQHTVSRAAEVLNISQPAASKLLMHLESDTGLKLFDRHKGRLIPTDKGLRLYEEVERIFAGVRQVDNAIAVIRREDQGRLVVGLSSGFAGAFMRRATEIFLQRNPNVYFIIKSRRSQWTVDYVLSRQVDIGITSLPFENPNFVVEALPMLPLTCIMAPSHPLAQLKVVRPVDLNGMDFVSFDQESYTGQKVATLFERHNITAKTVVTADVTSSVVEFVASNMGISLVPSLFAADMAGRIVARRFEPKVPIELYLCYAREVRNIHLVSAFAEAANAAARLFNEEMERSWQ